MTPDQLIATILATATLASLPPEKAVDDLGNWVDFGCDAGRVDVLKHVLTLATSIDRSKCDALTLVNLDYYLANAWAGLRCLKGPHPSGSWEWEQPEIEHELLCLRRAMRSHAFAATPEARRCQILTNAGNCLDTIGRFVEAIDLWEQALAVQPRFGMACGNLGIGLWEYARAVYDPGHAAVLAKQAHAHLQTALLLGPELHAVDGFLNARKDIEARVPQEMLEHEGDMDGFPLGDSDQERLYRRWCLQHGLFLNPLNDLGPFAIASQDVLTAPSIVVPIGEGPWLHGLYSQIKQEYCSARWLAYTGTQLQTAHFSDRDVQLYNTLDYPAYGLAVEQLKLAFRSAYSLFDKIAYFLNAYLALSIQERSISFRGLWFTDQSPKKGIRDEFAARANWPLRGLFWLARDLYEDNPQFRDVLDPDAQRMREVRNHLEHKYLKVHLEMWRGPDPVDQTCWRNDTIASSLRREDLERMTLRLLKLARAALIYLSLGIHSEERLRASQRPPGSITPPMPLDTWEDDWKQ